MTRRDSNQTAQSFLSTHKQPLQKNEEELQDHLTASVFFPSVSSLPEGEVRRADGGEAPPGWGRREGSSPLLQKRLRSEAGRALSSLTQPPFRWPGHILYFTPALFPQDLRPCLQALNKSPAGLSLQGLVLQSLPRLHRAKIEISVFRQSGVGWGGRCRHLTARLMLCQCDPNKAAGPPLILPLDWEGT